MTRKQIPVHLQPHPPTLPTEARITPEPEPLWRRVKTIERVLNWFGVLPPDQVDDRGEILPRFSDEHVRCAVQERESSAGFQFLSALGPGIMGAAFVTLGLLAFRSPIFAIQAAFIVIMTIAVARSGASTRGRRLASRAATLLESNRCGACGQLFNELTAREPALVQCTECGSWWNTQRFSNARADDAFIAPISKPPSVFEDSVFARDDRLVSRRFAKASVKSMKAAARRTVPDWVRRKRLLSRMKARAFGRGLVLSLRWSVPTLAVCWIAVIYAAHVSQPTYQDFVSFAQRGCFGLAAVVCMFSGVTALSHVQTQRHLRDVGLCPTCHGPLDPSATPEFDGCIRCTTCGCLWKRDAIAREVALDQPAAARGI